MRKLGILSLIMINVVGCGPNVAPEPAIGKPVVPSTAVESEQARVRPRLWLDDEAAAMIKVVSGYTDPNDKVSVIRWENGNLSGWVKFESRENSTPLSYNLSVPPDRSDAVGSTPLSSSLSVPPDRSDAVGVDHTSGWLVVAMRKLSDSPGEAYDVRIEEQYTLHKGNTAQTHGFDSRRGTLLRVPPDVAPEDDLQAITLSESLSSKDSHYFALKKWQDGESVSWLELRLGALSSAPESNAEPTDEREPE